MLCHYVQRSKKSLSEDAARLALGTLEQQLHVSATLNLTVSEGSSETSEAVELQLGTLTCSVIGLANGSDSPRALSLPGGDSRHLPLGCHHSLQPYICIRTCSAFKQSGGRHNDHRSEDNWALSYSEQGQHPREQ